MAKAKETSDTERNTQETDAKTERNAQLFEAQIHALEEQITFLKSNYTKEAIAELITYIESIITQSDTSFYTDAEARTVVDSLEVQTHIITNLFMSINSVPLEMTSPSISYIQVLNYIHSISSPTYPPITIKLIKECVNTRHLISEEELINLVWSVLSELTNKGIISITEDGTIVEPLGAEPITDGGGSANPFDVVAAEEPVAQDVAANAEGGAAEDGASVDAIALTEDPSSCSLLGVTSAE